MKKNLNRREFLKKSAISLAAITIPNVSLPGTSEAANGIPDALIVLQLSGGMDPMLPFPLTANVSDLDKIRAPIARIDPSLIRAQIIPGVGIHPGFFQLLNLGTGFPNHINNMKVIPQVGNAFLSTPSDSHEEATIIMTTGGYGGLSSRVGWTARLYDSGVNMRGFYGSTPFYNCESCNLPPVVTTTYEDLNISSAPLYGVENSKHIEKVLETLSGYKTKANGAEENDDPIDLKPDRKIGKVEEFYRKSQRNMFHAQDKIIGRHGVTGTLSDTNKSPLWNNYASLTVENNGGVGVNWQLGIQFRNIAQTLNEMKKNRDNSKIIFVLEVGGFDMHDSWTSTGNFLMWNLGSHLKTFLNDLHLMGLYNSTALFCCTEFGRTIATGFTGSGTDHGAGYTSFIIGGNIKGGIYGTIYGVNELIQIKNTRGNAWPREVPQERIIAELIRGQLKLDPKIAFPGDFLERVPTVNGLNLFKA